MLYIRTSVSIKLQESRPFYFFQNFFLWKWFIYVCVQLLLGVKRLTTVGQDVFDFFFIYLVF